MDRAYTLKKKRGFSHQVFTKAKQWRRYYLKLNLGPDRALGRSDLKVRQLCVLAP